MNISQTDRSLINNATVYNAANGEYYKQQHIDLEYVSQSTKHKIVNHPPRGIEVIIDKQADDLDKVYAPKGTVVPPDEILDMLKPGNLKIPIVHNEDKILPDSELLKVIHYFVSRKISKADGDTKRFIQSMDETAFLAMGMLVESWVDELIDEELVRMFLENYSYEKPEESDIDRDTSSDDEDEEEDEEDE